MTLGFLSLSLWREPLDYHKREEFGVRQMQRHWPSIRCSYNRCTLVNGCRHRRAPKDLDTSLEIGKNRLSHQTFEDRHMLTRILIG